MFYEGKKIFDFLSFYLPVLRFTHTHILFCLNKFNETLKNPLTQVKLLMESKEFNSYAHKLIAKQDISEANPWIRWNVGSKGISIIQNLPSFVCCFSWSVFVTSFWCHSWVYKCTGFEAITSISLGLGID